MVTGLVTVGRLHFGGLTADCGGPSRRRAVRFATSAADQRLRVCSCVSSLCVCAIEREQKTENLQVSSESWEFITSAVAAKTV